jgi:hypothetical protein
MEPAWLSCICAWKRSEISINVSKGVKGQLTGRDLVIAGSHCRELLVLVKHLRSVELCVQKIKLLLTQVLSEGLGLILLSVDVVADIVDLALSLLDSSVELHRLFSRVLQVLLQVRDLARELALGC